MALFPYTELKYYTFALRVGTSNLLKNGFKLGIKKTFGKIIQPINSYTRFPEYYCFEAAIREYLPNDNVGTDVKILDVGSPKMLGVYLAFTTRAEVTLTDISNLNVDEYRSMWRSLKSKAKGKVLFSLQDARSLRFLEAQFDAVFSMSVIEHIEGDAGDSEAVRELVRVLKPGGLLILSVPFGSRYIEQQRLGFSSAVNRTNDRQAYFFQRIYDRPTFENRLLAHAGDLEQVTFTTVWRKHKWVRRILATSGENLRGALGFLNPLLSAVTNQSCDGINSAFEVQYGISWTPRDVYGDLIMVGRKSSGPSTMRVRTSQAAAGTSMTPASE